MRKTYPTWSGNRISAIRDRIVETFETGRVTRFEINQTYRGPDPRDAHVHAAAVACGADILLTANVVDFVWDKNSSRYEVMDPDSFLTLVDDANPNLVAEVAVRMCRYWVNRSEEADLPRRLRDAGCPQFADRVRKHLLERI